MSVPPNPARILDLWLAGKEEVAQEALRAAFAAAPDGLPSPHLAWGRVASALGFPEVARRCYEAARKVPADAALATQEIGRLEADAAGRIVVADGAHGPKPGEEAYDAGEEDPPEDLDRAARTPEAETSARFPAVYGEPSMADLQRFLHHFSGRAGVHARQWLSPQGEVGWSPVQTSLQPALLLSHLRGDQTLGIYLIGQGDLCRQIAFDLDATKAAIERAYGDVHRSRDLRARLHAEALRMRDHLRSFGFDPLVVDSGYKGYHLWCLLPRPLPASEVRAAGLRLAAAIRPTDPELNLELFPKQDRVVGGGLGNLIKLPLGLHKKTDRRCAFLDENGRPHAEPFRLLARLRTPGLDTLPPPPPGPAPVEPSVVAFPDNGRSTRKPNPPPPRGPRAETPDPDMVAPPPPFTEADFDSRPRIAALRGGCPVLDGILADGLRGADLDRDERLTLAQVLGHLPEAVEGVNYIFERVAAPTAERLGRPLRGSPMSCKTIRQRCPERTAAVPCNCRFAESLGYPHPLLHAAGVDAEAPEPEISLEKLARDLEQLEERIERLEGERATLLRTLTGHIASLPGARLTLPGREFSVAEVDGMPVLERRRASA